MMNRETAEVALALYTELAAADEALRRLKTGVAVVSVRLGWGEVIPHKNAAAVITAALAIDYEAVRKRVGDDLKAIGFEA